MRQETRPAGRPRDEATGPAILDAARRLVHRKGYAAVSISDIVKAAGVSRQSLYRRWSSKADVILDAFFETAVPAPALAEGDSRLPALRRFLVMLFAQIDADGKSITELIAASVTDPDFGQRFREKFVKPRENVMRDLLEGAVAAGELPRSYDIDTSLAALHGAFWYRVLNREPLTDEFAERLADMILRP